MIYRMYLRTFFVTLSTAVLTIILAPAVYILVGMHISDLITALITGTIILLASGLLFYSKLPRQMTVAVIRWIIKKSTLSFSKMIYGFSSAL